MKQQIEPLLFFIPTLLGIVFIVIILLFGGDDDKKENRKNGNIKNIRRANTIQQFGRF